MSEPAMIWEDLAEEQTQYAQVWKKRAHCQPTERLQRAMRWNAEDAVGPGAMYRRMHERDTDRPS